MPSIRDFFQHKIPLFLVLASLNFQGCYRTAYLDKIEGERLAITDSLASDESINTFIEPYRTHINKDLDGVLSYSVGTYTKSDGELNTAVGNLFADAVFEMADPVFFQRTGKHIDLVLLNHGGIRAPISKGAVTKRTAYEIMPFENEVVIAELDGNAVKDLVKYLIDDGRAHPISKLKISVDANKSLKTASLNGRPIEADQIYHVATNDYLFNGGSDMDFFKKSKSSMVLNYKLRNVLIDYFTKHDTLNPMMDDRFIKIQE